MNSTITRVKGRAVYIPGDDIDTDRIIPARFMRCVTFDGLGRYAFYDVRYDSDGNLREHPLNGDGAQESPILIVGRNFGCGSSREHAPQALYRYGFRGIIGRSFAEIFAGNCVSLGFPAVVLDGESWQKLLNIYKSNPDIEISINLSGRKLTAGGSHEMPFQMPASSLKALVEGKWDTMAELLAGRGAIEQKYRELPYLNQFREV